MSTTFAEWMSYHSIHKLLINEVVKPDPQSTARTWSLDRLLVPLLLSRDLQWLEGIVMLYRLDCHIRTRTC
jgi:hypothetical protein